MIKNDFVARRHHTYQSSSPRNVRAGRANACERDATKATIANILQHFKLVFQSDDGLGAMRPRPIRGVVGSCHDSCHGESKGGGSGVEGTVPDWDFHRTEIVLDPSEPSFYQFSLGKDEREGGGVEEEVGVVGRFGPTHAR